MFKSQKISRLVKVILSGTYEVTKDIIMQHVSDIKDITKLQKEVQVGLCANSRKMSPDCKRLASCNLKNINDIREELEHYLNLKSKIIYWGKPVDKHELCEFVTKTSLGKLKELREEVETFLCKAADDLSLKQHCQMFWNFQNIHEVIKDFESMPTTTSSSTPKPTQIGISEMATINDLYLPIIDGNSVVSVSEISNFLDRTNVHYLHVLKTEIELYLDTYEYNISFERQNIISCSVKVLEHVLDTQTEDTE